MNKALEKALAQHQIANQTQLDKLAGHEVTVQVKLPFGGVSVSGILQYGKAPEMYVYLPDHPGTGACFRALDVKSITETTSGMAQINLHR